MIKVDYDCGNTFYPEAPSGVGHINRERKKISKCCKKPKSVPSNGQHKCSIDEQNTTYIFPNPYNSWETEPAALMSFKTITDGDSVQSDTLEQQLTKMEQSYLCCFLRCENWTIKGRVCSVLGCF